MRCPTSRPPSGPTRTRSPSSRSSSSASTPAEEGQKFVEEFGLTYAVGPDKSGTVIREYDVKTFPTTIFLDADHNIVRKWAGPLNEEKLNELIEEILPAS